MKESVQSYMNRNDDLNKTSMADKEIELNILFNDVIRDALATNADAMIENEEQLIEMADEE